MKYLKLIRANLFRSKRRTILTVASVAAALFLFVTLRSVLTTLDDAKEVGSETRMVTRSSISIVFPLPEAYYQWLQTVPGVSSVTWSSWFGGVYRDPKDFFATLAVDAETYLPMYPEIDTPVEQREAFMAERTAAIVGSGLMERFGWSLNQTINLRSTIYSPGEEWPFTIRAVYEPTNPSFGDENFFFHYEYLYEKSQFAQPGWYIMLLSDPTAAASVAETIDEHYKNSRAATRTETERAFQTGFVTMYGNVGFLLNAIGMAVFFAILFVAANTMMMSARERVNEQAVLKTLGFSDGLLFALVMTEAAVITIVGGLLGVGSAKLLFGLTGFQGAGFLPGFEIKWSTSIVGLAIAVLLGVISGFVPAWQALRLPISQTLRRVA
jgi:putative ABC transport system permease protein